MQPWMIIFSDVDRSRGGITFLCSKWVLQYKIAARYLICSLNFQERLQKLPQIVIAAEKVIQMVRKISYKFDFPDTAMFDQTGSSLTCYHSAMLRAAKSPYKSPCACSLKIFFFLLSLLTSFRSTDGVYVPYSCI